MICSFSAIIDSRSKKDRENDHIADRHDQKGKRRNSWNTNTTGSGRDTRHNTEGNYNRCERYTEDTEPLMHLDPLRRDQIDLRDKDRYPGSHGDAVGMDEETRERRVAESELDVIRRTEADHNNYREKDRQCRKDASVVLPPIDALIHRHMLIFNLHARTRRHLCHVPQITLQHVKLHYRSRIASLKPVDQRAHAFDVNVSEQLYVLNIAKRE